MDCSSHSDTASCHTLVCHGNGLNQLPAETATLPQSSYETNDCELLTSSLPGRYISQSTNASLNAKIAATALPSPIKHHVHKVRIIAEQLCAETIILHQGYAEMKVVMNKQKEKNSGKCKILKGHGVITRPDVIEALERAERIAKQRKWGAECK